MAATHAPDYLLPAVIFLGAGLVAAPVCRRLKVSPVLGYLGAGIAVGPGGFAVIDDPEGVREIAEVGIILLLFAIGLELSWERLKALRRLIFGLGAAQMAATTLVIGMIAHAWGNAPAASLILGLCFAFSSTAVAMQMLTERREIASPAGQVGFAILLFQDIAVAPVLLLVQVLSVETSSVAGLAAEFGLAIGKATLAIVVIVLIGRFVLGRLFRLIARERSPELFMAAVVLTALATAWLTNEAGLSTALGAFLAGLLLAETEFRAQVEADIEPFKGLMIGLFFMGVGMSLDPRAVLASPVLIPASIIGVMLTKAAILYPIARAFRQSRADSLRVSALLSQAGEFGFVVVGAALITGVLAPDIGQFMAIVVAGTMLLSPGVDALGRALVRSMHARDGDHAEETPISERLAEHVIIAGYGRVGRLVARTLNSCNAAWAAVDVDARAAVEARADGDLVLYGDAARLDMLERAGLAGAAALVVTLDDPAAAARAVGAAVQRRPDLPVLVRARDPQAASVLSRLGATAVVPETLEPGLQLANETLVMLGTPPASAFEAVQEVRAAELDAKR